MQKLSFRNIAKMYNGFRVGPPTLQRATLTTLNLNTKPVPKQPVPDLKKTAERYLKSLRPLLNENEYCKTEKIVNEFITDKGEGPKLHKKLLERYEAKDNWLNEWWLNAAYLGYRSPVIVNSSPGVVSRPMDFKSIEDMYLCSARLIKAVWEYDTALKSGKVKQEMARDAPLDMQPYALILGSHRQPRKGLDKLIHTDESKHIIIMCNNHFFKLCIANESGLLSENVLIAAIKDITERSCARGKPIGSLTGNDRDTWADDSALLLGLGDNEKIVRDIECSLFVLCLDKELPKEAFKNKNVASVRAVQSLTGFSSSTNAGNRWHDKIVQFIISTDGFVGLEYEHSPCEGVPVAVLFDQVLKYLSTKKDSPKVCSPKDFPRAELLKFKTNDSVDSAIEKAVCAVDKISEDIDMDCFTFDQFGSDQIKKMKQSPDSFIQIAMNAAYFRIHGKPPAHYESAGLRRFNNSRTECIRSTSCESVEFAKVLTANDSSVSKEKKKEFLIRAINAHKELAGKAASGEGVDRHLFGLKMIAQEEGMKIPEIYKDVGYTRSTTFTLTSSQVPFKTASFMCYGPVAPDGYGCCYNPKPDNILFACSSFKKCDDTDTKKFATALSQTLCDMKNLLSV